MKKVALIICVNDIKEALETSIEHKVKDKRYDQVFIEIDGELIELGLIRRLNREKEKTK